LRTFILLFSALLLLPLIEGANHRDIRDLDEAAVFSFAIMSDNKGDSPYSSPVFAHMVEWINESRDAFVIGLGDHVKKDWANDFLTFLQDNEWWHRRFYPNVADGENEYYGSGQGDWGAGSQILNEVDMDSRPEVSIRDNRAEYYARIAVGNYTVHLIQLSFSDTPSDPGSAFREDSREYLIDTLNGIDKGERDIVVLGAHSIWGSWVEVLSEERMRIVMEKADLILSATTHYFTRIIPRGYAYRGGLCLNTGSITHPSGGSDPGYLQVHVLENPLRLVVHYHDASSNQRTPRCGRFSLVKEIPGIILEDICTYDPIEPTCWPENPQITPGEVVQGREFTIACRAAYRSFPVKPDVSIDLSKVGGVTLSMFDDGSNGDLEAGDGIFSLRTVMPGNAPLGSHDLKLTMKHGKGETEAAISVTVHPAQDHQIFSDHVHPGWVAEEMGGASLEQSTSDPYVGSICHNISVDRGSGVRYRFTSQGGLPTSGFRTLNFAIRSVTMTPHRVFIQATGEAGSTTTSLADLGYKLPEDAWGPLKVPLESIGLEDTRMEYIRIYSVAPANFFLDDLRISTEVNQAVLQLIVLSLIGYLLLTSRPGEIQEKSRKIINRFL
jgi:hypothetical protein